MSRVIIASDVLLQKITLAAVSGQIIRGTMLDSGTTMLIAVVQRSCLQTWKEFDRMEIDSR